MEVVMMVMMHELRPTTIRSYGMITEDIDTRT